MKKRLDLLTVEDIEFSLFDSSSPVVDEGVMTRSRVRREAEIEEESDLDLGKLFEHNRVHIEDN